MHIWTKYVDSKLQRVMYKVKLCENAGDFIYTLIFTFLV